MKRTKEEYELAISESFSIAETCRKLGIRPTGGNYRSIHNAIKKYNLDTSHFTGQGWNIGLKFNPSPAQPIKDILVENSSYQVFKLKNRLLKEGIKEHKCECCGLSIWLNEPIPLELHHINGDSRDHRLDNLQMLCPNCHAKTDTYRRRKKSAPKETLGVEQP